MNNLQLTIVVNEILTWIFGGGLVAALVAIVTLRATLREAQGKAEQAHADADSVKITNTEHATRILVENIVEPLKQELNETRKELSAFKREVVRLRKAIDAANSCNYSDDCPVLHELRDGSKEHGAGVKEAGSRGHRQRSAPRRRDKRANGGDDEAGDGSGLEGDTGDSGGQPP